MPCRSATAIGNADHPAVSAARGVRATAYPFVRKGKWMRSTFRQIYGDLDAAAMSFIDTMLRVSAAAIPLVLAPMHAHAAMRQDWTRPVLQIGQAEGQDAEILGRIGAVKVDASGNIFILDTQANEVRWYGPEGGLRGRAGRSGEGPGEFRLPIAMALDSAGLVNVLDARNARISIYRPTAQGLAHVEDIRRYLAAICAFYRIAGSCSIRVRLG